jgi:hypothetical protein
VSYSPGQDVPYTTQVRAGVYPFSSLDIDVAGRIVRFPFIRADEPPRVLGCRCVSYDVSRWTAMIAIQISRESGYQMVQVEVEEIQVHRAMASRPAPKDQTWEEFCTYADEQNRENQRRRA